MSSILQAPPNVIKVVIAGLGFFLLRFLGIFSCILNRRRAPKNHYIVNTDKIPTLRVVGSGKDVLLPQIPALVSEMRACADSGIAKPYETRLAQLKALRRLIVENEDRLVAAIRSDLGRPAAEAVMYDFLMPLHELDHVIGNLHNWMKPQSKSFNILTFPGANLLVPEPLGLVLVIGTWNFPVMLNLVPLIGAIAGGNCVVMKPCNVSPATARLLTDLIPKYLDSRVVSVVGAAIEGDRHTTAALLEHKFDHVFFTGSPSVGQVVLEKAAKHLTPCTLELGGKNPVFVDRDANLDLAAQRVVWGRMLNAGQQCIAPDYVLCHRDVVEAFLRACAQHRQRMYGDEKASRENVGRIVGDKQMQRLVQLLKTHGGRVICGGSFNEKERYIEPTVLHISQSSPAMQEETFGPILLVASVNDMDEAIAYVNARPKPLSLYVFTQSKSTANRIVANTSSGGVTINHCLLHCAHPELPFGGIGESGTGAYHGKATFDTFVHFKPVLHKSVWPDGGLLTNPFFLYPPWTDGKLRIIRFLYSYL